MLFVVCGKTEILLWNWKLMERDFPSVASCTFCYKCVLELFLPLCMTKMVSACIELGGMLWIFSSVVIEGSCLSRGNFMPFLASMHDENVRMRN